MYAYVRNSPRLYVDPSGTVCVSPGGQANYDDPSIPGASCAEVERENRSLRFSAIVVDVAPKNRDLSAEVAAEQNRLQIEARLRAQREAERRARDQELSEKSKAVITVAYYRTSHDLGCVCLGGIIAGGGGVTSAPMIPKPFSGGGTVNTSVASTVLGGGKLGTRVPTPVGMPGTSSFAWRYSINAGRIAGRYLPYIGTVAGAAATYACLGSNP